MASSGARVSGSFLLESLMRCVPKIDGLSFFFEENADNFSPLTELFHHRVRISVWEQ